jgi:hypothetical protein
MFRVILKSKQAFLALALALGLATNGSAAPKKPAPKAKPAAAAPAEEPEPKFIDIYVHHKPAFDSARVRKLYLDGDFEEAIGLLESAIQEKKPFTHGDSVFFCKHLGVMYAAKYDTREKGKYYMHMLLMVEPTAKILDMYASDMIYMIFKNIQDEFDETRMRLGRAEKNWKGNQGDTLAGPKHTPPKGVEKESGSHTLAWVGAGTVVVAAGVATYFIFNADPGTQKIHSDFPAK